MELVARSLRVARGSRTLVERLDTTFGVGEIWAVLGPNGSGKSSLLLTLAGELEPAGGEIRLDGAPLKAWSARPRAERVAWQGGLPRAEFGFTVAERLALVPGVRRTAEEACDQLDLTSLATRRLYELSAGERQRVELAALWLRDAPVWLLDEPTAHLDLRHQIRWLGRLREEASLGRTIVTVLHDLTQAHAIADRALLLSGDGRAASGAAAELLTPERLGSLFGARVRELAGPRGPELVPEYSSSRREAGMPASSDERCEECGVHRTQPRDPSAEGHQRAVRGDAASRRAFSEAERRGVYRAIHLRRDVRTRFLDHPIEEPILWRLLEAAHAAPSVGLMQPWRFIRIRAPEARRRLHEIVSAERLETAAALGGRGREFLRLKVEGIRECAELLVIALKAGREEHIFGRRTLPEMDVASVGCAVENLWLAARAEGIGVGWVSLFESEAVARALDMPAGSAPTGILCLGYVEAFDPRPALELAGWAGREPLRDLVFEDRWGQRARAPEPASGAP